MDSAKQEWEIGLSTWIIQDGNYDNFETGQNAEFALEFYSQTYRKSEKRTKSSKSLGGAKYEINGEVIYLTPEVWVLDFGICAFQESKAPAEMATGDFVAAEIYLGIDPFFYFEMLYALPKMPPLIYSWKISSICQQKAPSKAVTKTDAWKDDGGNAQYILTCSRLDEPPTFERTMET